MKTLCAFLLPTDQYKAYVQWLEDNDLPFGCDVTNPGNGMNCRKCRSMARRHIAGKVKAVQAPVAVQVKRAMESLAKAGITASPVTCEHCHRAIPNHDPACITQREW